jgi:hypothetical protein
VAVVAALVAIMGSALFPVAYSLWLYKKLEREGALVGTDNATTK